MVGEFHNFNKVLIRRRTRNHQTVLGEVGMIPLAGGPSRAELGWWVGAPYRRRHVATRAVGLFATWLRDDLEFNDLFAEVDPDNPASVWVAEANNLRLRIKQ